MHGQRATLICISVGGSVQIVVDVDAITDASETNPDLQVVDSFTLQLLQVEGLANITSRCIVEVGLTSTGNIQIVFKIKNLDEDADFCHQASKVCLIMHVAPHFINLQFPLPPSPLILETGSDHKWRLRNQLRRRCLHYWGPNRNPAASLCLCYGSFSCWPGGQ